jgi:hypothetical protein
MNIRRGEGWKYSSTRGKSQEKMEMSNSLHARAVSPSEKTLQYVCDRTRYFFK